MLSVSLDKEQNDKVVDKDGLGYWYNISCSMVKRKGYFQFPRYSDLRNSL